MPLYDYQCPKCEKTVEVQHPIGKPEQADVGANDVALHRKQIVCLSHSTPQVMEMLIGTPAIKTVVRGNADFPSRERERLKKRANDHWRQKGHKEAQERAVAKGAPARWVPKTYI